jgi:hypothetical protein
VRRDKDGEGATARVELPTTASPAPRETNPVVTGEGHYGEADPSGECGRGGGGARASTFSRGDGHPPAAPGGRGPRPCLTAAVDHRGSLAAATREERYKEKSLCG